MATGRFRVRPWLLIVLGVAALAAAASYWLVAQRDAPVAQPRASGTAGMPGAKPAAPSSEGQDLDALLRQYQDMRAASQTAGSPEAAGAARAAGTGAAGAPPDATGGQQAGADTAAAPRAQMSPEQRAETRARITEIRGKLEGIASSGTPPDTEKLIGLLAELDDAVRDAGLPGTFDLPRLSSTLRAAERSREIGAELSKEAARGTAADARRVEALTAELKTLQAEMLKNSAAIQLQVPAAAGGSAAQVGQTAAPVAGTR